VSELSLSDGTSMVYSDVGQGQPVVMLHGWAMSGGAFWPQDALADQFRVIRPDLRGFGASVPTPSVSISEMARDISALLAALDLEGVILIGWSMGAAVGWHVLLGEQSKRISHFVSIDMSAKILNDETWTLGLKRGHDRDATLHAVAKMGTNWLGFVDMFVPRILAPRSSKTASTLARLGAIARACDGSLAAKAWLSLADYDVRETVRRVSTPTTLVYGGQSQLYSPLITLDLLERLTAARAICFPNAGHAPHLEDPSRFNALIRALASVDETGTGTGTDGVAQSRSPVTPTP
jgi:pimeloyl-ACP methyl ester carboxylesterase